MEKKNLKWYEAPAMELVDVKLQGMLCASTNAGNVTFPEDLGEEEGE